MQDFFVKAMKSQSSDEASSALLDCGAADWSVASVEA